MKINNPKPFAIRLKHVVRSRCELGEGLFVKNGAAAWVDINKDQVFLSVESELKCLTTKNKPSIIYDIVENEIKLGCDVGLTVLNSLTKHEVLLNDMSDIHDFREYRSNDGGFCGGHRLLGFMRREAPETKPGYVYRVSDSACYLLDESIHIPNSFIEIEPSKVLISDSLTGQIWLYELDAYGNFLTKVLWVQLESGVTPDGGCLAGDYILVALWDAAAIAVFDRKGNLLDRLSLPVLRPTNCKFDPTTSQLWVTSASEGLSKDQMDAYPYSGDTLVYTLEANPGC